MAKIMAIWGSRSGMRVGSRLNVLHNSDPKLRPLQGRIRITILFTLIYFRSFDVENIEKKGRDVILYYIFQSLASYGSNPLLVARQFVSFLKREMKDYSKDFVGEEIDPGKFKGLEDFDKAVGIFANNFVERKMHGNAEFLRPDEKTMIVKNLENCTYKGFAEICVKHGHKGCIFCPITFAGLGGVAAAVGVNIVTIDSTFDTKNGTCTVEMSVS